MSSEEEYNYEDESGEDYVYSDDDGGNDKW